MKGDTQSLLTKIRNIAAVIAITFTLIGAVVKTTMTVENNKEVISEQDEKIEKLSQTIAILTEQSEENKEFQKEIRSDIKKILRAVK